MICFGLPGQERSFDSNVFEPLQLSRLYTLNSTQVLFLLGALAASIGVFTYSQRAIKTVGKNVLSFSPMVAWIVILSESLVLILFSSETLENFLLSLNLPPLPAVPVSSTQAVIGAIVGIGLVKGGKGIKWSLVIRVVSGWVATPVIAFMLCFISLFFMENVFRQVVSLP